MTPEVAAERRRVRSAIRALKRGMPKPPPRPFVPEGCGEGFPEHAEWRRDQFWLGLFLEIVNAPSDEGRSGGRRRRGRRR